MRVFDGRPVTGLAIALLLAAVVPATAQNFAARQEAPIHPHPQGAPPKEGEIIRFAVRWLGIPIGRGEVRIRTDRREGRPVYVIEATAESNAFLTRFYPVRDRLTAWVDARDFYVLYSEKDIREGRYRAHERVAFDYDKGVARWESLLNGSKKDIPLEGPTQDVLSAFYWLRQRGGIRLGGELKTPLITDEKAYELTVRILGTEKVELRDVGTFEAFVVEPVGHFKGVLVDRGRAWVHLTADEHRLPLKVKLKTPYGPVTGVLEALPEVYSQLNLYRVESPLVADSHETAEPVAS